MTNLKATQSTLRFVLCQSGQEAYAVRMNDVNSIQRVDRLRMDRKMAWQAGWLVTRSGEVPVYDFSRLTGQAAASQPEKSRVLIMNPVDEDKYWGLLVEQVSDLLSAQPEEISPLPDQRLHHYGFFRSAVRHEERMMLQLDARMLYSQLCGISEPQAPVRVTEAAPTLQKDGKPVRKGAHQLVIFSFSSREGTVQAALSSTQVMEILSPMTASPIPGSSGLVDRFVQWRGMAIPILNLAACLGIEELGGAARKRLMIVRASGQAGQASSTYGIFVNPAIRILTMPIRYRMPRNIPRVPTHFLVGAVEIEHKLTLLPDLTEIIRAV